MARRISSMSSSDVADAARGHVPGGPNPKEPGHAVVRSRRYVAGLVGHPPWGDEHSLTTVRSALCVASLDTRRPSSCSSLPSVVVVRHITCRTIRRRASRLSLMSQEKRQSPTGALDFAVLPIATIRAAYPNVRGLDGFLTTVGSSRCCHAARLMALQQQLQGWLGRVPGHVGRSPKVHDAVQRKAVCVGRDQSTWVRTDGPDLYIRRRPASGRDADFASPMGHLRF